MVKTILKNNSVTLSEFADILCISRPTLDSYIKSFDYNGYLTNPVFNNVFSFLFGDSNISNDEFTEKYTYIQRFFGKKAIESSSDYINSSFSSLKNESSINSALKNKIVGILGNSEFTEETLQKVLSDLQTAALSYQLIKEFGKYAFYHESVEDGYYLVFKVGVTTKKDNTIKIDNLYHYIVYKTNDYDDACSFIKEYVGEDVL